MLLSNLKKKSPEECVSENDNRTANRRTSRVTCQLAISSKNRAQVYRNTKDTKICEADVVYKQDATVV